jgi:U3 small nucleolar RNA-associated protein 14
LQELNKEKEIIIRGEDSIRSEESSEGEADMLSEISSIDSDEVDKIIQSYKPIMGNFGISDEKTYSDAVSVIQSIFHAKTVVNYYMESIDDTKGKTQSIFLFSQVLKKIVEYNKQEDVPILVISDLYDLAE